MPALIVAALTIVALIVSLFLIATGEGKWPKIVLAVVLIVSFLCWKSYILPVFDRETAIFEAQRQALEEKLIGTEMGDFVIVEASDPSEESRGIFLVSGKDSHGTILVKFFVPATDGMAQGGISREDNMIAWALDDGIVKKIRVVRKTDPEHTETMQRFIDAALRLDESDTEESGAGTVEGAAVSK